MKSFFEVMSEVKKDPEDVSAGIGKKKYKVLNKFSCNFRSKSARSTLTSPGPIMINTAKNVQGNHTRLYPSFKLSSTLLVVHNTDG
jgi:hypothetical protein